MSAPPPPPVWQPSMVAKSGFQGGDCGLPRTSVSCGSKYGRTLERVLGRNRRSHRHSGGGGARASGHHPDAVCGRDGPNQTTEEAASGVHPQETSQGRPAACNVGGEKKSEGITEEK